MINILYYCLNKKGDMLHISKINIILFQNNRNMIILEYINLQKGNILLLIMS